MSKRIIIVGGGYLGVQLAKALDDKADVTLIEPRSHFAHAIAMIRAVVQPHILDNALIPYDTLLKNGKVVQAKAAGISQTGVTLEDGREVSGDYIVVATGSSNATPFKPKSDSIADFRADHARVHDMITGAQHIAIVGAGAVGTELAGEIAHFMPDKKVTLVSSGATLFPQMPDKLGTSLHDKLTAMGVTTVLGVRAENLESLTDPYAGNLILSNGDTIKADLIYPTVGSRAKSDILETLPGITKTHANRIKTDAWLRPSDLPNVFAAGDVADAGDAMTGIAVGRHVAWLEKTLISLMKQKNIETITPYKPADKAPILVPLGPEKGSSYLVLFCVGDAITRFLKSKDLFLTKYNKVLGRR